MVCCTDNKKFVEEDANDINIETQLKIINIYKLKKILLNIYIIVFI